MSHEEGHTGGVLGEGGSKEARERDEKTHGWNVPGQRAGRLVAGFAYFMRTRLNSLNIPFYIRRPCGPTVRRCAPRPVRTHALNYPPS
jgi:hypothetical protein